MSVMKRLAPSLIILFAFFILVPAHGKTRKSYRIQHVDIVATVNTDGSMYIQESRTYKYSGSYSWADYRLAVKGFSRVEDFSISEDGLYYQANSSEAPHTFQISSSDNEFYAKWFYKARNETRTFVLSFKVMDVLKVYQDIAELYYNFIGPGWDRTTGEVSVTVVLPEGAGIDEIRAWAHGPLWGNVRIVNANTVALNVEDLPRRSIWDGRIVFPARLVPDLRKTSAANRLDGIIAEETRRAEIANEERIRAQEALAARNERWKTWTPIIILATVAAFLIWFRIYRSYGRQYPTTFRGQYYSDIPTDLPPALISYFVNGMVSGSAMVATMFDLARKGFLKIEESSKEVDGFFGKKRKQSFSLELNRDKYDNEKGNLEPHEADLIGFVFDELAGGLNQISMKEIAKSRSKTQKWFSKWRKLVSEAAKEIGFYDKQSRRNMLKGLYPSIGLLLFTPVAIYLAGPAALAPGLTGFFLLVTTAVTKRVSKEYADQYAQWKALKRYLRKYEFSQADSTNIASRLDNYLIYGLILGLSSNRIKELIGLVPTEEHAQIFPWYIYPSLYSDSDFGSSFGNAVSSMVSVASSSLSSATGAGGGASAGAGGGAGGSGGGAG